MCNASPAGARKPPIWEFMAEQLGEAGALVRVWDSVRGCFRGGFLTAHSVVLEIRGISAPDLCDRSRLQYSHTSG
jgi:hypothetical protein